MKKLLLIISIATIFTLCLTACDEKQEKIAKNVSASQSGDKVVESSDSKNTTLEVENTVSKEDNKEELIEDLSTLKSGENIKIEEKVSETPKENKANSEYTTIKFSDMYETKGNIKNVSTMLKNLNGKKVHIKGYPAVQSPLDESFVYLNNQPYVTCPFCTIGDVTKLEVIPIFMANKSKIKYTENAMEVYGTLEIAAKVDSEGYTTQFRIYADKVTEVQDSTANKAVNDYYAKLSEAGMIYDIQTLQMNIEYVTNPQYMAYYDEKLQTGASTTMDKIAVLKAISNEYLGYDSQYAGGFGSGYVYLDYIKECPDIVKACEPQDERLKKLNNELIELYNKQTKILEKYQEISYKIHALGDNLTDAQANTFIKELTALNPDNMKLYEEFTNWNNKLRE